MNTSLFILVYNNLVLKARIVSNIKVFNRLENDNKTTVFANRIMRVHYHTWAVIKVTPHLLCRFGSLKQVKEMVEGKLERKYSKYKWSNDNYSDTPFIPGLNLMIKYSISGNHLDTIQYLYNRYKSFKDEMMYGMVSFALSVGNLEIAKYIGDECECKYPTNHSELEMDRMVKLERKELLEYYIEVNLKHNCIDYYDNNYSVGPYQMLSEHVVKNGHFELFKKMYYGGIVMSGPNKLETLATQNGHIDILQFIIKEMTLNPSYDELTRSAALYGQIEVFKYLENLNRNKSMEFYLECITYAAHRGHLDIVKHIINYRSTKDSLGIFCKSALDAIKYGHIHIVQYILQLYPDIFIYATLHFDYFMEQSIEAGDVTLTKLILDNTPESMHEPSEPKNRFCVSKAANSNNMEMVKFMLDSGWGKYNVMSPSECYDLEILRYIELHNLENNIPGVIHLGFDAFGIAIGRNNMELFDYVLLHPTTSISARWSKVWHTHSTYQIIDNNTEFIRRLLEVVPPLQTCTTVLKSMTLHNNPVSLIKLLVEKFPVQTDSIFFIESLGNAASKGNLETFAYLLPLYSGTQYTKVVQQSCSTDNNLTYVNLIMQYFGDKIDFKEVLESSYNTLPICVIKSIQDMGTRSKKLDINSLNISVKSVSGLGKIQYLTENYPRIKYTVPDNLLDVRGNIDIKSLKYILKNRKDIQIMYPLHLVMFEAYSKQPFKCVIPVYKYQHTLTMYTGKNMDIIRFIHFNESKFVKMNWNQVEGGPNITEFKKQFINNNNN